MRKFWYTFAQLTWGFLQSLVGFVIFLANVKRPHMNFHGAICTAWKLKSSLSLGLFIFVSDESICRDTNKKARMREDKEFGRIAVHEYGHTIQSLIWGPLYLLTVGAPSIIWASLPAFKKMRVRTARSYYDVYPEAQANRLGERFTGQKSPGKRL